MRARLPPLARSSLVPSDTAARAPLHRGWRARYARSPPLIGAGRCVGLRPPAPPLIASPFATLKGLQITISSRQ